MENPSVSFIIIEYHSVNDVSNCVTTLTDCLQDQDIEIIVSSNSCYDSAMKERLIEQLPHVKWVFNPRNGGFAYGMNRGLEVATGRYLVIMNSDVRLHGKIKGMMEFLDTHAEVGVIAPKILNSRDMLQDSARSYVTLPRFLERTFKRIFGLNKSGLDRTFDYDVIQTVDWVIGAFIMVRREVYERTKGLDEGYFMYAEDLDWCTRIRRSGHEIVYYPMTVVEYEGSRSARRSVRFALIFLKSHLRYWWKFGFFGFGYPKRSFIHYCLPSRIMTAKCEVLPDELTDILNDKRDYAFMLGNGVNYYAYNREKKSIDCSWKNLLP